MSSRSIRVLVVDDSRLMRTMIGDQINAARGMELAGSARDGVEAVELVRKLRPDVVTMDVEMPRKNGLEALTEIMRRYPVPVFMVSALTESAANITLDALDEGAVDYIAKPASVAEIKTVLEQKLISKIRFASNVDLNALRTLRSKPRRRSTNDGAGRKPNGKAVGCIAIGISTGGPPALTSTFEKLEPPLPPIIVVQHMPAQFTGPFASRLDGISQLSIKEAQTGDLVEANSVLIAPGGKHLEIRRRGARLTAFVRDGDPVSGHMPSVDVMMRSVVEVFGHRCLGVIMTGMGSDGAGGCAAIKDCGGFVIGQDEESSAVYGMNRVPFDRGHVDEQFSLSDAADTISQFAQHVPTSPVSAGTP